MKYLLLGFLFLFGCSEGNYPAPKFKYGDKVKVPGFYSECKGYTISTLQGTSDLAYVVQLNCSTNDLYDTFTKQYRESELSLRNDK